MTKAEGVIVVMTQGVPEGMQAAALVGALRPLLPSPPPGAPGPFALSDEATLRAFATDAGLTPIEVFDVDSPWSYPDEATAVQGLNSSGVSTRAMDNSSEAAVSDAHRQTLAPFRRADGGYHIGASFRCLLARPQRITRNVVWWDWGAPRRGLPRRSLAATNLNYCRRATDRRQPGSRVLIGLPVGANFAQPKPR